MIIAEISQNFASVDEAKQLIKLADANGADLVKAQLFDSVALYGKHVPAELSFEQARDLFNFGKDIGIEVFFSVFDIERVKWCEEMGVKRYKIAHSQRFNEDLRKAIDFALKPYFISISDWREHPQQVDRLYCVPSYPARLHDVHLRGITFGRFGFDGFSDHTIGIDAAKIALARGAKIIEKHFSISHDVGVDAPWSMTPEELKELVRWENVVREVR